MAAVVQGCSSSLRRLSFASSSSSAPSSSCSAACCATLHAVDGGYSQEASSSRSGGGRNFLQSEGNIAHRQQLCSPAGRRHLVLLSGGKGAAGCRVPQGEFAAYNSGCR